MNNIFAEYAPLYWAAGIPAMPLKPRQKVPILSEWNTYGTTMPSEAIRSVWLETFPHSNIGLPFGPASGLCAIDIDTEDEELIAIIRGVLPPSPWVRLGKKGMGLIYRWHGQKNFKMRGADGMGMILEHLGLGNQMVLPPSIHPDTGLPYTSDNNLWEVLDRVHDLPRDIEEQMRAALGKALGTKGLKLSHEGRSSPLEVVPEGTRDINLVRHAGYLARVVRGIDKSHRWSLKEAMEQMYHWVESYTASVSGDDMDPLKGVAKLLEFLVKDIEAGATMPNGWDAGLTEDERSHGLIALLIEKNDGTRWTLSRAQAWILRELGSDAGVDKTLEKIQELVYLVARDKNFTEFEFDTLFSYLKGPLICGKDVPISKTSLKAVFKDTRNGGIDMGQDHDEIARSVAEAISRGGEIRHYLSSFWQWDGSCFKILPDNDVLTSVGQTVKGNALSRRYSDYAAVTKMIANVVPNRLVECADIGINFANGFLDQDLILRDHSPIYGKTFTLQFDYIPERAGECHKWLEYLEQSWGDDEDYVEKVMALQEAFAVTMFGLGNRYQKAILLHGQPGTGKTRALEVLKKMMPSNAVCSVGPHLWGERFGTTSLIGAALNVCGELPEHGRISGDQFKQIVEGGEIWSEFKGKDGFNFVPECTHWFASNHLPISYDTSEGFTRRWLILDFNRRVPLEERIPDFDQVLINEEQQAIAAWAVQGLRRMMENEAYTIPASSEWRANQILRSNNSVAAFLQSSEQCRPASEAGWYEDLRDVFEIYGKYMKEVSRGSPMSIERLNQVLSDLGYKTTDFADEYGVMRQRVFGVKIMEVVPRGKAVLRSVDLGRG